MRNLWPDGLDRQLAGLMMDNPERADCWHDSLVEDIMASMPHYDDRAKNVRDYLTANMAATRIMRNAFGVDTVAPHDRSIIKAVDRLVQAGMGGKIGEALDAAKRATERQEGPAKASEGPKEDSGPTEANKRFAEAVEDMMELPRGSVNIASFHVPREGFNPRAG